MQRLNWSPLNQTRVPGMRKLIVCGLALFALLGSSARAATPVSWVATWAASPQSVTPGPDEPLLKLEDQTVRERVRVSVGGDQIRICLSNEYGSEPLRVGAVSVAVPRGPTGVQPGSVRKVTFASADAATIPAGAPMLSDPVAFPVVAGAEISISIYFPGPVHSPTLHALALKRAIVSQRGDHTTEEVIGGSIISESSIAISAVLVPAQPRQRLVVAFGDSFVDGDGSSLDLDRTWPHDLARRFAAAGANVAVANEGLAGNRLLRDGSEFGIGESGLARFDRDVLAMPSVTHLILYEGLNDIGFPGASLHGQLLANRSEAPSADVLIRAYRQLIARAHTHAIKVIGTTICPFASATLPGYYSESKEATRQVLNQWIRTSGEFDAVIDFDEILREPNHPNKMMARYLSEDGLHPNDAGYQALADAIDLRLFD